MSDSYAVELEPEWCADCSAPSAIVDDHVEEDAFGDEHRVLDLACGHSLNWRIKS